MPAPVFWMLAGAATGAVVARSIPLIGPSNAEGAIKGSLVGVGLFYVSKLLGVK